MGLIPREVCIGLLPWSLFHPFSCLLPRLWLCTFTLAVSLGAVLLLPFSIISNEVLLSFPQNYYIQWLNGSLIHGELHSCMMQAVGVITNAVSAQAGREGERGGGTLFPVSMRNGEAIRILGLSLIASDIIYCMLSIILQKITGLAS